ncbi:cAMP-binding domain of CRP or a regulatory subunit of cAMP-dependent protein kinases [Pseudomonas peli]|uniref:cAMP-binding domain of CRP or a regulatory subunit of cAMP-dependent protein kinases n=2 Tax=Pseudomonas TaxID=286 RepID=A0AB37Z878_9PSED|nr:Crp/Fnr family transcriptional regulator [Pseudomonas peli]NMZ69663.1 Crp/Fnr family transcriptional regulator [Pseudomonas peli]SCW60099.1 cAMP-binding domain of CRP or a regulatory subunit of cAMP-dependent protein kinases [Pseudomonas peli]
MSVKAPLQIFSRLIEGLPSKQRKQLLNGCEPVDLVFGNVLHEANQPIRHVYFPLSGFVSLVTTLDGHQPLEMGLIGNEGMLGATLALGIGQAPMRAVVQGSGSALRISSQLFKQELLSSPALLRALKRYLYVVMTQLSQSAACTHFHEIEPRLARWLLMTHDRAHADNFHLTHEYLADMLGVRRSGVSIAAAAMQARGLISYSRGEIHILDRAGLELAACECYAALQAD